MAGWNLQGNSGRSDAGSRSCWRYKARCERRSKPSRAGFVQLEDRMTHLEAGQGQLIAEAKGAASSAASMVASAVISEVVTRVTRMEMRLDVAEQRLLPPPS